MRGDGRGRETEALAGATEEAQREAEGRTQQETDETAADLDQTHADFALAESDADQLASDADQRQADRDQHASDRDQVVADWEHLHVPAAALTDQAHQTSRTEREAASRERGSTAAVRSRTTGERQMAEIEQWDGHVLGKLMQRGSMTVREIRESVERGPFELPIARAWVEGALERGLIAKTGGSDESARYHITAAGRNTAGVQTGRFVVSEKARDDEPSRRSVSARYGEG